MAAGIPQADVRRPLDSFGRIDGGEEVLWRSLFTRAAAAHPGGPRGFWLLFNARRIQRFPPAPSSH